MFRRKLITRNKTSKMGHDRLSGGAIYGWGERPGLSTTRGFFRLGANVSDDTLTIESSFTATYKLTSATSATALRRRGESRAQADMVKVDLAALIASGKKFAESIMISTKLRENGKPVRLRELKLATTLTPNSSASSRLTPSSTCSPQPQGCAFAPLVGAQFIHSLLATPACFTTSLQRAISDLT